MDEQIFLDFKLNFINGTEPYRVELLAVEKWLACISISGVCLKRFCCVTPNYPHRIFRGNEHQMRNHLPTPNA